MEIVERHRDPLRPSRVVVPTAAIVAECDTALRLCLRLLRDRARISEQSDEARGTLRRRRANRALAGEVRPRPTTR